MPIVKMPDGTRVRFPDDMPREQIRDMIASKFPDVVPVSTAGDVTKAGAAGLARGAADLVGLPGTLADAFNSAVGWGLKKGYQAVTGEEAQPGTFFGGSAIPGNLGGGQAFRGYLSDATGGATDYVGKTRAGKFAGTVGEFVPGAAAFGGTNPANLLRYGVVPGVASEAAGQATEGTWLEPWARVGASIAAPIGVGALKRVISPYGGSIGPLRAKQIQTLEDAGVPLTAGQRTGNKNLAYKENMQGGRAAQNIIDDQAVAFTDAAMRKAGGSGLATPDNLSDLRQTLSKGFDDISKRNTLILDRGLVDDFSKATNKYATKLDALKKPVFDRVRTSINTEFVNNRGRVSGEWYQQTRSELSDLAQSARGNDNQLANAYRGLRDALDDAMERSIQKTNPSDLGLWKELRKKWGNFKVVADASNAGGEVGGGGIITPARLAMAARKGKNGLAFATGKSDFTDLAKAGQSLMTPLPNSGTGQRIGPLISSGVGATTGAVIGSSFGAPALGGIAGSMVGAAIPDVAGSFLMTPLAQAYLSNQLLGQTKLVAPQGLLGALMEYGRRTEN